VWSVLQYYALEAFNKTSNSLTSDRPVCKALLILPSLQERITTLEQLFPMEKVRHIESEIHAHFAMLLEEKYGTAFEDNCAIYLCSPEDWAAQEIHVSNDPSAPEKERWFFYLDCDGLQFSQNYLAVQHILCEGPFPRYTLTWHEFIADLHPKYRDLFTSLRKTAQNSCE
jgi:hypothetical protein